MRRLPLLRIRGTSLLVLAVTAGVLTLIASCTDGDGPGPTGPLTPVGLLLRPTLASTAAAAEDAPPVNLIRATVEDAETGTVLATVDTAVDPEAEAWTIRVEFEIEGASASVRVLLELLNVVGGVETPVWVGEVGPIEVTPGEETEVPSEDVELFRGPPDNLSVTSVAIRADSSRIVEGAELALDADVVTEGDGQEPLVFWTSLDDEVATVDDQGVVSALLPGAAPIVAEAGPHADTLEVTVLALPVRVVVRPDTVLVEELGTTVGFTASVEDERGEPVERDEVEWSVDDPTLAESLGGGDFTALATGETRVRAVLVSDPEVTGSAVLIIETGPEILRSVEGDGQEAVVNTAVPVPPAVQVLDASERPLEGVEVLFEVTSEEGTVTGATARTDAEGVARPEQWVLGATAGTHTLQASVPEAPELPPVGFEAVALPGEPGSLELVEGDGQEARGGTAVEIAPAVRVLDEFGNPVPGAAVTFVPDDFGGLNDDRASVAGSPAEADAEGVARLGSWTLGIRSGTYTLGATAGETATLTLTATALPTLTPAMDVGVGFRFSCALNAAGEAFCWGTNGAGGLGTEAVTLEQAVDAPVAVDGGHLFQDLEVSGGLACGVTNGAELFCWGRDQITAPGPATSLTVPTAFTPGFEWAELGIGLSHACGVTFDGVAYCWGNNDSFQIGDPDAPVHVPEPLPVTGGITFEEVHASIFSSCGLATDGSVYCWGSNFLGALGDPEVFEALAPNPVATDALFAEVDAGAAFYCARTDTGEAHCWGSNTTSQTGIGVDPVTQGSVTAPTPVAGGHPIFDPGLSAENSILMHACALDQEGGGTVLCWGYNGSGQLGGASADLCLFNDEEIPCAWDPQVAGGGLDALVVDTGLDHTCAVTFFNEVACWGGNASGQLGNGSTIDSTDPVVVLQPRDAAEAVVSAFRAPSGVESEVRLDPMDPGLPRH